ncbi:MAG: dephospho-CoA kinase [Porphyromonadaceae bacterium]|nr:dephospho-CoA kinase [Porphyromonadaceae bacterium]
MQIVGITGGIGSGKSVVSRFLQVLGYPVYDSDREAKRLLQSSTEIKAALTAEFGDVVGPEGNLDNRKLAAKVFSDGHALNRLNAIVHPAVRTDFKNWCSRWSDKPMVFMESAILIEAGFFNAVDVIWLVTAPETLRVQRIVSRNGFTPQEAWQRIRSQQNDSEKEKFASYVIVNDGERPIIPQVLSVISSSV